MPARIEADPHLAPGGRYHQLLDAGQSAGIGNDLTAWSLVAKTFARTNSANARELIGDVDQTTMFDDFGFIQRCRVFPIPAVNMLFPAMHYRNAPDKRFVQAPDGPARPCSGMSSGKKFNVGRRSRTVCAIGFN